jgi:HD-like signal output (HDOD) protein
MNHAELGAMIAEKWNFPETLVGAIRYHHVPGDAPADLKNIVDAVYIANMFCEYENGNTSFDQLDSAPLENYGINSQQQFDALIEKFSSNFNKEKQT